MDKREIPPTIQIEQPIDAMRSNFEDLKDFLSTLDPQKLKIFKEKAAKKLEAENEELQKLAAKLQELHKKKESLLAQAQQEKTTQAEQHKIFSELIRILEQEAEVSGEIQAKQSKIALWSLEID